MPNNPYLQFCRYEDLLILLVLCDSKLNVSVLFTTGQSKQANYHRAQTVMIIFWLFINQMINSENNLQNKQ